MPVITGGSNGRSSTALALTEQPFAPWHVIDGTDRQHRALEAGRVVLAGLEGRIGRPDGKASFPVAAELRRRAARVQLPTRRLANRIAEEDYDRRLEELQGRLALLRRQFAKHSVVAVFEGRDAAGKGGAIRRITETLDARETVWCRRRADARGAGPPCLWRFWCQLPPRGIYTIFDRSWYGRVLVERVDGSRDAEWQRAYREINEFEPQLAEHAIVIVKFWMSVARRSSWRASRNASATRSSATRSPRGLAQPQEVEGVPGGGERHDRPHQHAARAVDRRASGRQAPGAAHRARGVVRSYRGQVVDALRGGRTILTRPARP